MRGILKTTQNQLYLTQHPWNIGKNYGFNPYFYFPTKMNNINTTKYT